MSSVAPDEGEILEDFYYRLRDILQGINDTAPAGDRDVVNRTFELSAAHTLHEYLPDYLKCLCKIQKANTLDEIYLIESEVQRFPIHRRQSSSDDSSRPRNPNPPADYFGRPASEYRRPQPLRGPRYDDQGNYANQGRVLAYQQDGLAHSVYPYLDYHTEFPYENLADVSTFAYQERSAPGNPSMDYSYPLRAPVAYSSNQNFPREAFSASKTVQPRGLHSLYSGEGQIKSPE